MPESLPVVLITGASRGLGRGVALRISELGCSIMINYVANEKAANETIDLCREKQIRPDQQFIAFRADISDDGQRRELVSRTLDEFGRIDTLVNNAGIGPGKRVDLLEMSEASLERVLATNLRGPHFLTQLVAEHWLKTKQKPLLPAGLSVVFISSVSAEMVSVDRGEYCMSKAGLSMAAKLWASRLAGEGIQVYEIRPGVMATDMTSASKERYDKMIGKGKIPQNRWGTADDVGLAVKAVVGGYLPFSAGTIIHVDGGLTIPKL